MGKDKDEEKVTIRTNDVLRGKPYLDIDRVIPEDTKISGKQESNNW
ncbi:hypothetical protein [Bacillus sp. B15-48]|nr:hypothetical protein [Bacillus sp. B15-48]MBM4765044.1 hypothetical protein [Bacillus sp. B15-48]